MQRASSRGYTIAFEDVGAGPAVVLVPGFLQRAADWRDRGYTARLAATRRVLAIDPLGHGHSDKPHEWEAYRPPDVAADVAAVLDAAGVERAAVGVLWAAIAAVTAIEFPDRVEALIAGGMWLGVTPEVVKSFRARASARSRPGDWPGFWATWGIAVPPELKAYFETNDPRAMSAVSAAGYESGYTGDVTHRDPDPAVLRRQRSVRSRYAPMDGEILGVELHLIPGHDHVGTFRAVDDVLPLALKHLQLHSGARIAARRPAAQHRVLT